MKEIGDIYLVFNKYNIGLMRYIGTLEELEQKGYKKGSHNFFCNDEDPQYEVVDMFYSNPDRGTSYKEYYKPGFITYFKGLIPLKKFPLKKKQQIILELFNQ